MPISWRRRHPRKLSLRGSLIVPMHRFAVYSQNELPRVLGKVGMVRAEGLEPSRALRPNGFSCQLRLSPPPVGVCGLDYPFTVAFAVGAARLVSTPSRPVVRPGLARDRHFTGFPEFEQFCIAGFPASTQLLLSPMRLPIPPRPHDVKYSGSTLRPRYQAVGGWPSRSF